MTRLARYFPQLLVALGLALCAASANAYLGELRPRLIKLMTDRFGAAAAERLTTWQAIQRKSPRSAPGTEVAAVTAVNSLGNRVPYLEDIDNWQAVEYWATPAEFVSKDAGDCEDYTIAKFFALRELGVAADKLRLVYVRAWFQGQLTNHMVLAYYASPDADPLVLDNINPRLLPASQRPDLIPVFSFNDDSVWRDAGTGVSRVGDASQVRRWRDLLSRVKIERSL